MPEINPLLPWPILSLAFGVSLYSILMIWRRNKKKRPLYLIFRFIATVLIFFCAFQPRWSTVKKISSKNQLFILSDQSGSMSIRDEINYNSRFDLAESILKSNQTSIEQASKKLNISTLYFDDELSFKAKSTQANSSAIGNAIIGTLSKNTSSKNAGIILLSDGINNTGADLQKAIYQSQRYKSPIYPIKLGKDHLLDSSSDIQIKSFTVPQLVQGDTTIQVKARISFRNLRKSALMISIKLNDDKILLTKKFIPPTQNHEQNFSFDLKLNDTQAGHHSLAVHCAGLENEITPVNNFSKKLFRLRTEGLKVLLLSTSPSANFKFLKRNLESTEKINLTAPSPFLFQSPAGRKSIAELKLPEYDAIILCETSPQFLPENFLSSLMAGFKSRPQGLLILPNFELAEYFQSNPEINQILPLDFSSFELIPAAKLNVDLNPKHFITKNIFSSKDSSQLLKQVILNGTYLKTNKHVGSQALLTSSQGHLLSLREWQQARIAILSTNALWQWNLKPQTRQELYKPLINRLVSYLASRNQDLNASLVLQSDLLNYKYKQNIQLSADFIAASGEAIKDANLDLHIQGPETKHLSLSHSGHHYQSKLKLNKAGLYTLYISTTHQDQLIKSKPIKILIESDTLEFEQINSSNQSLQKFATETQGKLISAEQLPALIKQLANQSQVSTISIPIKSQPIWDNNFILALIILSFCLEWYLRRRDGLA